MTAALEWPAGLDVPALVAAGFEPRPLRDFVLKIHQRCNLACDYCYVYTSEDQTWRDRPPVMTDGIWRATAARIREHVRAHDLSEVRVILHGGEPQVDSLKSAYPGAAATGLTVTADPFDRALGNPGIAARQLGAAALGDDCRGCAIHRICGGGHYPHRYAAGTGFRNRSVYCADLSRVITHVRRRLETDLAGRRGPGR